MFSLLVLMKVLKSTGANQLHWIGRGRGTCLSECTWPTLAGVLALCCVSCRVIEWYCFHHVRENNRHVLFSPGTNRLNCQCRFPTSLLWNPVVFCEWTHGITSVHSSPSYLSISPSIYLCTTIHLTGLLYWLTQVPSVWVTADELTKKHVPQPRSMWNKTNSRHPSGQQRV